MIYFKYNRKYGVTRRKLPFFFIQGDHFLKKCCVKLIAQNTSQYVYFFKKYVLYIFCWFSISIDRKIVIVVSFVPF